MTILDRGTKHSVSLLDIRLDNDVIIFRGTPAEAPGALLKGVLTFCLQDPLSVRGIQLKLICLERVNIVEQMTKSKAIKHEKIIYEKDWQFLNFDHDPKKSFVLNPGNYEYPFEHVLPGHIPESVEGLQYSCIVYKLKATISRHWFAQDIHTKKHLRIVRTLAPTDEALSSTMSVDNTWPNKCEYSINIPAKAVVFGSSIPIFIAITSLLKGLNIGKVTCTLREFLTLTVPEKETKRQEQRTIRQQVFDHGAFQDFGDGTEKWFMQGNFELPRSLAKCVQDCEVGLIKVRHKLKISVQLHNPDGHTSELRASLPVQLFISPNHLMGEDNVIHTPMPTDQSLIQDITAIPPRYDEHVYDRLWDDIPHDHYSTPLQSGANTPGLVSRTNSNENLAALSPIRTHSSLGPHDIEYMGQMSPTRSRDGSSTNSSSSITSPEENSSEDLHASLAATGDLTANTTADTSTHYASTHRSAGSRSAESSRPSSADETAHSSHHPPPNSVYHMHQLSRVPSYRTALRAGPKSLAADSTALPLYDDDAQECRRRSVASISQLGRRTTSPHEARNRRHFTLPLVHGSEAHGHAGIHTHSFIAEAERLLRIRQARD